MSGHEPTPSTRESQDELILAMLRDVLARQVAMGRDQSAAEQGPDASACEIAGPATPGASPVATADGAAPAAADATADDTRRRLAASGRVPMGAPGPAARLAAESTLRAEAETVPASASRWEQGEVSAVSSGGVAPGRRVASGASDAEEYRRLAAAEPVDGTGVAGLLRRLCAGLLAAAILINVPFLEGLPLARALPDQRALVVRDGLVLKGSGPEIYVLEDGGRRWISSLDAFEHFGYDWSEVHEVRDEFLERFPEGRALHVLLKCPDSPHIYRLEGDRKRWIRDIEAFEAEGHVWEDVDYTSCGHLRTIADGPPIPPDAGTPEPDASTTIAPADG